MVGIDGKLDSEVLLEVKGKCLPAAMEDELIPFLWPRCITRRGEALETHGEASDGLLRRRQNLTTARVCGGSREEREREMGSGVPRVSMVADNIL
jgi:hypothetical protein